MCTQIHMCVHICEEVRGCHLFLCMPICGVRVYIYAYLHGCVYLCMDAHVCVVHVHIVAEADVRSLPTFILRHSLSVEPRP